MDGAIGFLFGSLVLLAWIVVIALAYKNRATIARWLNDPNLVYGNTTRRRVLRRRIEDAEAELEKMDEITTEVRNQE